MQLRDYQVAAVEHAISWLSTAKPGDHLLFASPTGTGKSIIEIEIARRTGLWIVTPRIEIMAGFLQKMGIEVPRNEEELTRLAAEKGIYTPLRLRNRLVSGDLAPPPGFILDEAHHDLAETWQDLHLLSGFAPVIGLTATPYRGSPRSTSAFHKLWGEPIWVITLSEAAARGDISVPQCETWPLIDDDLIEIRDGEMVVSQVEAATISRLDQLCALSTHYIDREGWDTPTIYSFPSRSITREFCERMRGLAAYVDGSTPYAERQAIFQAVLDRRVALAQIQVVSEGVDLPIRRLIDVAPCMSPVKWLQQVGRVSRPGGKAHYICTNRNLLRHGYLLDGCVPNAAFKAAETVFGGPSKRGAIRAIGLEAIGRLKGFEVRTQSGLTLLCYSLSSLLGHKRTDYFVLVHPNMQDPIWARKENFRDPNTAQVAYGRWQWCEPPADLRAFNSVLPRELSEKQRTWWQRSASYFGLDAGQEITRKQFPILPVLADLRMVIR